jgi:hypothetical protein
VVIHILINIPQKACSNDAHHSKRNTRQVHILVALGVRQLAGRNHHLVSGLVASNARDHLQAVQQARSSESYGVRDVSGVRDAELELHGTANVFDGIGDEFLDKNVVVGGVADSAADDANRQGESSDGGNEVIGADDGSHDGGWHNYAANAQPSKDQKAPDFVKVVNTGDRERAATWDGGQDVGEDVGLRERRDSPAVIMTEEAIISSRL